jgi:hypothetical protein
MRGLGPSTMKLKKKEKEKIVSNTPVHLDTPAPYIKKINNLKKDQKIKLFLKPKIIKYCTRIKKIVMKSLALHPGLKKQTWKRYILVLFTLY